MLKASEAETPRNGVRTAIEDFLGETDAQLSFTTVAGFHGVGILVDRASLEQPAFAAALASLESPEFLKRQCERLEHSRLWAMVQLAEARQRGAGRG